MLDYAPANGADVTANLLEPAPCKQQLCISRPAREAEAEAQALAAEAGGTAEALPYMHIRAALRGVEDPVVRQVRRTRCRRRWDEVDTLGWCGADGVGLEVRLCAPAPVGHMVPTVRGTVVGSARCSTAPV